ncbi:MAG: 1-acyl-sn-glycerol-3-phosphate acyltransferase [Microthrixaceae bacterium]
MSAVLPPRLLRRALLAPAMVGLTALILAVTPLVVLVLAFLVRFLPGRWRALRLFWFLLVYLLRESLGIFGLISLWVMSGCGWKLRTDRFQQAHFRLTGWYLRGLIGSASKVLGLSLVTESVPDDLALGPTRAAVLKHRELPTPVRPVLVFSRHAGAGDSFILAHLLINVYGRQPRIVLKDLLQLDPCIDIVLNRLPSRFISPNPSPGSSVIESIETLATDLEPQGALLLFPEGGNFSEHRKLRAIERLRQQGLDQAAQTAEGFAHVLPPRPAGTFAAIDASPDADVLFVAHTGLEQLSSVGDLWAGIPMDREVRLTWWTVRHEEIPVDSRERLLWLYQWWEQIDDWIDERRDPEHPSSPLLATNTMSN